MDVIVQSYAWISSDVRNVVVNDRARIDRLSRMNAGRSRLREIIVMNVSVHDVGPPLEVRLSTGPRPEDVRAAIVAARVSRRAKWQGPLLAEIRGQASKLVSRHSNPE
ncbi:hypothetical protein BDS110ZK4_54140 [Bradyrhizobium diazoefficiens]|nr:hypothetical protein H12S4_02750 [Bradyrhizobium diazoefficiens]BCA08422.1 hypothetical protein BDHF08_02690 [Bradyrhizobium diazoefficiens]BCA17059.1 hypothetical protein BDHH15_02740 [Bradyrhizobium diazoefficiens]BCE43924.1 hypothetical protein XF4B_02730 [Bradyrhizobium diazoefficiens]BCE52758.1 hypothetical protein XF5B_02700 [Bradyrhizobium diazoefficiens]